MTYAMGRCSNMIVQWKNAELENVEQASHFGRSLKPLVGILL